MDAHPCTAHTRSIKSHQRNQASKCRRECCAVITPPAEFASEPQNNTSVPFLSVAAYVISTCMNSLCICVICRRALSEALGLLYQRPPFMLPACLPREQPSGLCASVFSGPLRNSVVLLLLTELTSRFLTEPSVKNQWC